MAGTIPFLLDYCSSFSASWFLHFYSCHYTDYFQQNSFLFYLIFFNKSAFSSRSHMLEMNSSEISPFYWEQNTDGPQDFPQPTGVLLSDLLTTTALLLTLLQLNWHHFYSSNIPDSFFHGTIQALGKPLPRYKRGYLCQLYTCIRQIDLQLEWKSSIFISGKTWLPGFTFCQDNGSGICNGLFKI